MSPKPQHRAHDNEEDAHFDPIKKFPTVDVNVDVDFDEDDLPTNVSKEEQLAGLPIKYLSGDPIRPLQATDEFGNAYKYALNPTTYSVIFILLVELLERFSFYGVNYTQTTFLTGAYDKHWNVGMTSVEASSFVSISTAMAYSSPFLGALMADCLLGDYWVILLGTLVLYIPGLLLIELTTVPKLLGDEFPRHALTFAILFLWPIGAGAIKSVVNIFGARQYHPKLQASMIESYYVNFYMCINVGALIGGILIPVIAQHSVSIAYFIPVFMLALGVLLFVSFTSRYVRRKPQGDIKLSLATLHAVALSILGRSDVEEVEEEEEESIVPSKGITGTSIITTTATATNITKSNARQLMNIIYISILTVIFNVVYSQMSTVFIVQGTVMKNAAGFIDAAIMNNADAISVLLCGFFVGNYLYPLLAQRKLKIYTTYKFAMGSFFGSLAIFCALMVEYRIHSAYAATGAKISILWQTFSYAFIGAGEIFAISAAYEIAFALAPKEQKALSSAINLFFVGGVPNFICMGLYHVCKHWFTNARGDANIQDIEHYTEAHVYKYFWVLLVISLLGMVVNLLPSVRDWVASVEEENTAKVGDGADEDGKKGLSRTFTELTSEPSFLSSSEDTDEERGALLKPPSHSCSPPSKTILHAGRAKKFVLLNRHASQYGSISKK